MSEGPSELMDCIKHYLSYYSLPTCGIFKLSYQENAILADDSWDATLRFVPTKVTLNYELAQ
jgi:hypothetical protein